ncbi:Uroporphyrin-III C/tetrapyrrole (Corrin/Porphyrin) methyltransferase [Chloroherpeton thalassium ATCC 35110]|uniref:Ribosomal RNA small subunit methyltransferase I n=1 Tax=Chloroherpeton thalassium (strain ATCC 35110 / GB-78) TaxID=517418 RepID=B3QSB3_CHLT3|nr:16S rRNA (cytidine(1402)-2'-O)-methyltransferase [Chloroherpeton thalassium]ACF12504.1 Uroporphyrin-III C/tetrapyrrole (Corrin/Porphyrin) methyltransferase [Chloroherpeton thalassium ATCC 35110]
MTSSTTTTLEPALYIVATPIGNLEDMTFRAVTTLRAADCIACEDTRQTRKLLQHFAIDSKTLLSYHNFNERTASAKILEFLQSGKSVALVSDAGTPVISDPGFFLVRAARDAGFRVVPIPGASALAAAVSVSPLPVNRFYFEGFLPQKKGRQTRLQYLAELESSVVLYESPHRILKLLDELSAHFGDRQIMLAREMTKIYEEFLLGTIAEAKANLQERKIQGEFVVIVEGKNAKSKNETYENQDENY